MIEYALNFGFFALSLAVLLSAESAAGKYPLEAVQWLARIAEDADAHGRAKPGRFIENLPQAITRRTDVAVAFAACTIPGGGGGGAGCVARNACRRCCRRTRCAASWLPREITSRSP